MGIAFAAYHHDAICRLAVEGDLDVSTTSSFRKQIAALLGLGWNAPTHGDGKPAG